ncbi:hypothetical protein L1994_03495 [Methanomicrobium antiquum]|uniref:Uncharacterized protein n=1 Tax=Methanomicrobium antiquum TaxID=487686 RepID=A0AAF0JM54_9EURY|nr:hypothetical protein [Methanomicrobium antiquum]WFN37464.1 hypothetical protein L1994_03495 [Methanomicrobium antiquum]
MDYEDTCSEKNIDPVSHLARFLDKEREIEDYWNIVENNLKNSNIRLLFIADEIPSELQRIIEYLNEQMVSTEVLVMEVKQYTGQNLKTLISRVVGRTMKATDLKAENKKEWNREMLLDQIRERDYAGSASATARLLDWCEDKGYWIQYGKGAKVGSVNLGFTSVNADTYKFFELEPKYLRIVFYNLQKYPPFDDQKNRIDLLKRFNEIDGFAFNMEKTDTSSNTPLTGLSREENFEKFCDIYDWMINQIEENL